MMTIMNEQEEMKKYEHVNYAEFQEMLCRVALTGVKFGNTSVDVKVLQLLKWIYEEQYENGTWNRTD